MHAMMFMHELVVHDGVRSRISHLCNLRHQTYTSHYSGGVLCVVVRTRMVL